jgi:hypothetical protein
VTDARKKTRVPRREGEDAERRCNACGLAKPITEFYPIKPGASAKHDRPLRTARCRRCVNLDVTACRQRKRLRAASLEELLALRADVRAQADCLLALIDEAIKKKGVANDHERIAAAGGG